MGGKRSGSLRDPRVKQPLGQQRDEKKAADEPGHLLAQRYEVRENIRLAGDRYQPLPQSLLIFYI